MPVIYSTLSNSNTYIEWLNVGGDIKVKGQEITIAGGAGIADKHLITPYGKATTVTNEELKTLESIPQFNEHVKQGWLMVQLDGVKDDVEKVALDMASRDKSSPVTPSNYENQKGDEITKIRARRNK